MKCTLNPSIASISGKSGGILYKTYKRPNGKTETRAYILPRKENGKYGYTRKSPVSANEKAARSKFTKVSAVASVLTDVQRERYAREWQKNRGVYNGKKYATLRGYIIARLYNEI